MSLRFYEVVVDSDKSAKLAKGYALEESLRNYFLRSGLYVVRGVPFSLHGIELTDVDLWMYERATGTSRRIHVVDAKDKQKPKAVERLFWTRGLVEALGLDGAYVATTDQRPFLRQLAARIGLSLIDGVDIKRIQASAGVASIERITDEDLFQQIQAVDRERRDKELQSERHEVLSALSEKFGTGSLVAALGCFSRISGKVVVAYPGTVTRSVLTRLAYLSASIAVISLDYLSVLLPFRSAEEKREVLLSAVRFGSLDIKDQSGPYNVALGLVRKYAPSSSAAARAVEDGLKADFLSIPAEIIADQAIRLLRDGQLFAVARELESACYGRILLGFDDISPAAKGMLGALLDYSGVRRDDFAGGAKIQGNETPVVQKLSENEEQRKSRDDLFDS